MKSFLLLFLIAFSFSLTTDAQRLCGFDKKMAELKQQNPEYALKLAETDRFIQNYVSTHPKNLSKPQATINIPVVVHIMHTGGAVGSIYNPGDAQIIATINYLNQVYAGTYAGMQEPIEGGGVVNMEIKFVLAQRTPTCGSTNGIDRVDATDIPNYVSKGVNVENTNGCSDLELKDFARWKTADYYNIWVVNKIDGKDGTSGQFIAGYAAFAGSPAFIDGTVMLATQMQIGASTLPHEIGHAFNLYHTFQGSDLNTTCPTNTNCSTDGDKVCDTDPVSNNVNSSGVYSFACRTGTNTCTAGTFTKNTESNFMAYTNCSTLFTNGQKARIQAAMNLPERLSLTTSLAATPCGPVINFNAPTDFKYENTTGTKSGCRTYKDYNYSINIGSAASASATVTLAYSGTATKGLDYDITTNGDFSNPSNDITIPGGTATPQPFTVRVYDDANAESPETIIINFSVNTSGNATKGTAAPTFTMILYDNDEAPVTFSTNPKQLGDLQYSFSNPFVSSFGKQKGQILYKASELQAAGLVAGTINSMQLSILTKNSTGTFNSFNLKLGTSALDYLYDGTTITLGSGFTTVYSNPSLITAPGWNTFNFTTPFVWNGTSSIVVEYCYNSVSGTGNDVIAGYNDGESSSEYNYLYQSGIDCSGSYSSVGGYSSGVKPIIKFGLSAPGTEVETATTGTHTEYLSPGSNDDFYSDAHKIIAKISNVNADLGCVQASIENQGNLWMPFLSANRSSKVFNVTPTTNASTTSYTISLYFTAAELGGRLPSSLLIAKTSAVSANLANAANTEFVMPVVTMLGTNVVFTGNFTGFSRFFLVENTALPVSILSFDGTLVDQSQTELHWKVSQQRALYNFEVERSTDGISFVSIGKVAASQGSAGNYDYSFTDKSVSKGLNYYRLKINDNDGQFKYSQVIKIVNNGKVHLITLLANPVTDFIGLSIENNNNAMLSAVLYNAVGSRVTAWQIGAATGNVQLPITQYNLTSGIYLLKVSDGEKTTILKVVKK